MFTAEMDTITERLTSDWNFIEEFLNNPEEALKNFDITDEERRCLSARNPEALIGLGMDKELVEVVLSGRHSPTCPTY